MSEAVNNEGLTQDEVVTVVRGIKEVLTELGLMKDGKMIFDIASGDIPYGKLMGVLSKLAISRNVGEKFKSLKEVLPILEKCANL